MENTIKRPLSIPFAELFDKPNFTRNVLIYKLWNEDWLQKDIARRLNISSRTVRRVLQNYSTLREWQSKNQDKMKESSVQYYQNHQEERKRKQRKYHENNKKEINARSRHKYASISPEYRKIQRRIYRQNNLERVRENDRLAGSRKRANKQRAFIGYVPRNTVDILWKAQKGLCVLCGYRLENDITLEHKIPLDSRRSIECICNYQLAHRGCNSSKMAKILPEYEELNQLSLQLNQIRR